MLNLYIATVSVPGDLVDLHVASEPHLCHSDVSSIFFAAANEVG
jgi:hypothetical protein